MRIFSGFCVACLKGYQWFISPVFSSLGVQCRFVPSCSDYAIVAVKTHGPIKGFLLSAWRLLRCQPLCKGGHDPVPGHVQCLECSHG